MFTFPLSCQAHGDCDPVVPYKWGQLTSQILREVLPKHEFKTYKVSPELVLIVLIIIELLLQGMMHSSSDEELQVLKKFIGQCLP